MVIRFTFLFSLLFLTSFVLAQQGSSEKSFVTLKNGEIIQGEILSEFDLEDYGEVEFISDKGEKSVFKPKDIQSFKLSNGRVFKSEKLPIEESIVFVQVLISGELELWKWNRKYLLNNEGDISELKVIKTTKDVEGRTVSGTSDQYIGILKIAMNDDCGAGLAKEIESSKLIDSSLINLFEQYYACSGNNYKVNVSQVPFSKVSFRIQGGANFFRINEYQSNKEVNYFLDKKILPYFEIGVRFKEFRTAPRLLVDLGFGYVSESNVANLESKLISFDLKGRQEYSSNSFLVPLQVSYVLFKKDKNQVYAGTGLTFWFTKFGRGKGELLVDNGEQNNSIERSDFVDRKDQGISPNLKLGYRKQLSDTRSLFLEVKGDYLIKNMYFYPLTYEAIYDYLTVSLTLGVEI